VATEDSPDSAGGALRELVVECLARMEQDGPGALEALCREHPAQAAALRSLVGRLGDVGLIGRRLVDGTRPDGTGDDRFPERLGEFRLIARLGGGGMGVVYLAEQTALRRQVALKLIRPELLYFSGARERFRREVEAVARLAHAGIVPVLTGGEEGGIPFFAMELVQGATLHELLDALAGHEPARLTGADLRAALARVMAGRPGAASAPGTASAPAGEAAERLFGGTWAAACLQIARAVAEALQHAHERGVLHRDVKPSNVMLTPDGRVLLLDFGLAQAAGNERVTRTGSHLGSLAYMSPEQVRGDHAAVDARSDVYSLGASLHELLALRAPFSGADDEDTRRRILEGRCPALRDHNPAAPRDAETVCQAAMELQPSRRYATAAALGQDLGAVLARRPIAARRPGPLLKARRWTERNPAGAAALALGMLLLVGAPTGYALVQRRAAETEKTLNADLSTANRKLDATLQDLQRSLEEEQRQRQRAERSFDRTLAAVDEMLTTVGADDLRGVPQVEPVRRQLLERALAFYRELEADNPGDADLRREQGRTHRSIAMLLRELGRDDEARPLFEQTLGELQALAAQPDATPEVRHEHAAALCELAVLDIQQARYEDAGRRWSEAAAVLAQLAAEVPVPPAWIYDHASALIGLGLLDKRVGQGAQAYARFQDAADLLAPAVAAHPEETLLTRQRADALNKAALIRMDAGRNDEAERLLAESWATYETLLAADATDASLRNNALECASNYGSLLLSTSDRALAEATLRRGYELALGLVREFPGNPDYRMRCSIIALNLVAELAAQERFADARPIALDAVAQLEHLVASQPERSDMPFYLGAACAIASGVHLPLGELDEALAMAQRGVELERAALLTFPDDPSVNAQLSAALSQLADVQRVQGELDAALATLDEALGYAGQRSDVLFQAAETLAKAATSARDAEDRPADERDALRREFEERGLATLRAALANGYTDFERIRTHSAFVTLRERPELEALLAPRVP
jgi:eukaryotic-like serine/threonine-protein kinase